MALLLATLFVSPAFAAHPLVSDDTATHGPGKYQLEVNSEAGFDRQRQDSLESSAQQVAAILSAGLGDRLDLVVGLPWQRMRAKQSGTLVQGGNGVGDVSLEVKWRFFEAAGFSLAVKPGVTLPSGDEDRGFGNGRFSGGVTMIATKELAPFTLHLNGAYVRNEFAREDDRQTRCRDGVRASLAALAGVAKNLQLAAEIALEKNSDRKKGTWPASVVGGAIYSLRDDLDVDLGVKLGLNEPATDLGVLAGFSLHF